MNTNEICGRMVALFRPDIDTDQILPARWLLEPRNRLGQRCFESLRHELPELDNEPRRDLVLIAGGNFGCGSSREQAVWALLECGVRAVIAPSFASIFRNNALNNGLVAVTLGEADARILAELARTGAPRNVELDLAAGVVRIAPIPFALDSHARGRLARALRTGEPPLTLERYESRRPEWMPRVH